jgi:hypothetical protein
MSQQKKKIQKFNRALVGVTNQDRVACQLQDGFPLVCLNNSNTYNARQLRFSPTLVKCARQLTVDKSRDSRLKLLLLFVAFLGTVLNGFEKQELQCLHHRIVHIFIAPQLARLVQKINQ